MLFLRNCHYFQLLYFQSLAPVVNNFQSDIRINLLTIICYADEDANSEQVFLYAL